MNIILLPDRCDLREYGGRGGESEFPSSFLGAGLAQGSFETGSVGRWPPANSAALLPLKALNRSHQEPGLCSVHPAVIPYPDLPFLIA